MEGRPGPAGPAPQQPQELARAWDDRVERQLQKLPRSVTDKVHWLRDPKRRVIRVIAGGLFVLGGIFSILPILGIWMLPLGLALLAEDFPGIKPWLERTALWVEGLVRRFKTKHAERARLSPPKR
jgi:hypothetical protein